MRYTPLATDALCPMPYALCPMPARAPHVTEKGYSKSAERVRAIAYYSLRQLVAQQKLIESVFELSTKSTNFSEVIAVLKRKNSCEALNQACVCSQSVLNTAIRWE